MSGFKSSLKDILQESMDSIGLIEELSPTRILFTLFITLLCALAIYFIYKFFYRGAVYNENFNVLLVMTSLVTAFIISTISSNLVLSLGMVGALSIVRFRSAIKDPLDIGFLFWSIAVGLTAGAKLYHIAIIGTVVISMIYIAFTLLAKGRHSFLLVVKYNDNAAEAVKSTLSEVKHSFKSKSKHNGITEMTVQLKIKDDTSIVDALTSTEGVESAILVEFVGD